MNQAEVETAIYEAEQALSAAKTAERACREAFLASVVTTHTRQEELTKALTLVADPEPPEEAPITTFWPVTIGDDSIALFKLPSGSLIERRPDNNLPEGSYVVELSRDTGAGSEYAFTEFFLNSPKVLRLSGNVVQIETPV